MRKYFFRSSGISKDWGKVKQKYERNYRNIERGILWVILWNLWMCYRQYPYDNTFGKKKYSYILPEMLGLRFVIYNVGLLLIANHFYGGQQWFRLMMPTIASASTFLIMFLTTFLWKEQLAKVLLGFCLCDFGGTAIVYGVPSLGFHPVVNAILSIIIFLIIYKIITPLLKKYQNYRIKHSYICSEILIVLILSGWLSNFLYVSIEDSVAAQDTMLHKMGIYFSTMVALSVTVVFLFTASSFQEEKAAYICHRADGKLLFKSNYTSK